MKTIKVVLVALFVISIQARGQFNGLGFRGGIAMSNTNKGISFDFTKDKGFDVAAFAEFKISNHWFFRFESDFEQNIIFKDHLQQQLGVYYRDVTFNLISLKTPLLINYMVGNKLKLYLNSGPYFSLIILNREKATRYSMNYGYWDKEEVNDVGAGLNSTSLGFTCGTGLQIPINQKIDGIIESRYYINFEPVISSRDRINSLKSLVLNCGIKLKI